MGCLNWVALSKRLEHLRGSEDIVADILEVPVAEVREKLESARLMRLQLCFVTSAE